MQLKIIGTNSLAIMPKLDHSGGHRHCNHCVLNTAPQPHEPEASVCIDKSDSEAVLSAGWRNMLSPFQDCRKVCHHIKSDLNSLFSLVRKCIFWSLAAVTYIIATSVLPGLTTFVACCSKLTNERISLFVAFLFFNHVSSFTWIRVSFSCSSLISICWISRIIPRNVKVVDGPSTLLGANGTPSSLHSPMNMFRFYWHMGDEGGPIVRKSSK